jgi:hypothetical protein
MISFAVDSFAPKLFNVSGWIIVEGDHESDLVQQAVVQALQDEFSYQSMQFGQPVTRSRIIKTMQEVDGVVAADVDALYFSTGNQETLEILFADVSELLLLNASDPQGLQIDVKPAQRPTVTER